jgi:predicted CXXCH cytochrome family protein
MLCLTWIAGGSAVMAQPQYSGAYGASPHCQSCHDTAPNNQFDPWHSSHHARAYENLPTAAKSNPLCLPCHTTGWDLSQTNGGFDDYFYVGDSLGMAQMRNVQCESCHGPTSQIPHPTSTVVDYHAEVCGGCHTGMGKPTYPEWSSCGHSQTAPASAQNLACAKCHEAASAAAYLHTGQEPVSLPPNPVWQVTCAACHATHSTPVFESQLYLPSDSTCRACHTIDGALVGETFYASQKEMLLGPGGGAFEWPGYTYDNSCHQTYVPDACVLCHMWGQSVGNPDTTTTGHQLTPNLGVCVVCHAGQIPPDSSFNINGCQTMIDSLLNVLGTRLAQADTTTIEYRRAKFDYDFVNNDKSHGVHNFMYSEDLLTSSIENLPIQGLVKGGEETTPLTFLLNPPRPNPFNAIAIISFVLPTGGPVSLKIYDTVGREVANLVEGWRSAGEHKVLFEGTNLPSGLYLCRLTNGKYVTSGKIVLLK